MAYQTLKNRAIGNKAYRYRLEKNSCDRVYVARLLGFPVLSIFSRQHPNTGSLQISSFALKKK